MAAWIDVATVRDYMQWGPDTSRDTVLQGHIDAACSSIEDIKGHVAKAPIIGELQDVGPRGIVILGESPVVSVERVAYVRNGSAPVEIPQSDPAAGVLDGWALTSAGGVLTVPVGLCGLGYSAGGSVVVDYTVGRDPIPPAWVTAAIELTAFLFDSSQNNEAGERVGVAAEDEDWPSRGSAGIGAYAMPFRVRELLGLFGKVVKSQVLVR